MKKLLYFLFLIYTLPVQTIFADGIIKEQTFQTSPGKTLHVAANYGDVKVTGWSKSEAYIKISGNDNAKSITDIDLKEKDGDIYITTSFENNMKSNTNYKLTIEISVPEKYNSEISTSGGDVSFDGINGNIKLRTAGGDIKLNNVSGKSELKTAGGDIKAYSYTGELIAKTAGGNIDISCTSTKISAKTAGGEVIVKYSGENNGIELTSSGGNINLFLPDNFGANVNLLSNAGEIKSDFEVIGSVNKSKTKMKGKINGGGEEISCKSNGGNITLERLR